MGIRRRSPGTLAAATPEDFAALFDELAPQIYTYCFRRTGDWALAEDLTSVVFLEAWRRRGAAVDPDMLVPWLYGVATNVLRNQWRTTRRQRAALARVPAPAATPDFADDAAERLDAEAEMRDLLAAMADLSARDQEILVLCRWQGLTYVQAAAALSIPVGTVRSRLARARQRLGVQLQGALS